MNHLFLVQHFLEDSARRLPDKVALVCAEERLTYAEINEKADRLAAALVGMGVNRQERVAIFLDNSIESVISLYGILKAGAIFIMLSATMKSRKLNYILKDSGARILITHPSKFKIVQEAIQNNPNFNHIIWCSTKDLKSTSQTTTHTPQLVKNHWFFDLISSSLSLPASQPPASVIDLDLATIIYTSGSTGFPKGVMSAHYNVISAAKSITTYLENVEDDIILCALPLSFDYGLYQVLMTFMFGGTLVLEKSFVFPYKVLDRLVKERATGFPLVPTMAALLLQIQDLSKFDSGSLRYISNTAAALPVSHIRKLQDQFPHVKIFSMYGLTECKRVSYLPPKELDRIPGSVGIPIPNEEVFVVDESGKEIGPDEIGELVIRGSNVMQGYWNAPEETAKRFQFGRNNAERLLYSGDLFRRDGDGFLYFVARMDDMIKTKGERVSPKEIENCLCELDGIVEAAVIGVPDDLFGQAVKSFIVANDHEKVSKEKILKHCQLNLEPFMVPKFVEFVTEFEKTSSGKIDKKKLRRTSE